MPPKQWDEEDSDSDSSSPEVTNNATSGRRKFDDEEDDSDVLDSWDAAEDSEVEREKAKKAEEAKAAAAAAAAAAKKPKGSRIAQHQAERARQRALADADAEEFEDETEADRRERLRRTEQEADLAHAADLFGDAGLSAGRAKTKTAAVVVDSKDPTNTVDIAKLPLFTPTTKAQFEVLRTTLGPVISANSKKPHYALFLQDFTKALAKEMPSDQIKKLASTITALGNEKMRDEKAADKGGKKTKAAKTKTSLVTGRANTADVHDYNDDGGDFGDDDFM